MFHTHLYEIPFNLLLQIQKENPSFSQGKHHCHPLPFPADVANLERFSKRLFTKFGQVHLGLQGH